MKTLPAHLQKVIDKREAEFKKLGGDPEWYIKAIKAAEKNNDNDAAIWAVLPC